MSSKEKKQHPKRFSFSSDLKEDFTNEKFIEGGIIRPLYQMAAFTAFVVAVFLLLIGAGGSDAMMRWGGSLIIISFVFNLYAIYLSLCDKPSIYRTFNLAFKIIIFLAEIALFNWILIEVLY